MVRNAVCSKRCCGIRRIRHNYSKSQKVRWKQENATRKRILENEKNSLGEEKKAGLEMGYLAGNYPASTLRFRRQKKANSRLGRLGERNESEKIHTGVQHIGWAFLGSIEY